MKIIFATLNQGKVKEMQAVLTGLPVEFLSAANLSLPEVEETGLTFIENAILKAREASLYAQFPALADDSGLVVKKLNGAPGIYSARYAGKGATDSENINLLLENAKSLKDQDREAQFICVLAYVRYPTDPIPIIAQATWDGLLLEERVGDNGFGYDPIFYIPSVEQSAAQLTATQKNTISHRAKALNIFKQLFLEAYPDIA